MIDRLVFWVCAAALVGFLLWTAQPAPRPELLTAPIPVAAYDYAAHQAQGWKTCAVIGISSAVLFFGMGITNRPKWAVQLGFWKAVMALAGRNFAAVILAVALIAGVGINSCSNRYVHVRDSIILDKWTGRIWYGPQKSAAANWWTK